jgi:flagellar hook assembly protein FlgD
MDPITSALPLDSTQLTSGVQPKDSAKDTQNQFLQLLVAQFVTQLAQFSSLEELTKIRTSMDSVNQYLTASAASARPSTEPQSKVGN